MILHQMALIVRKFVKKTQKNTQNVWSYSDPPVRKQFSKGKLL